MNFRATSFSIESRAIRFSSLHNSNILKYQEQISSGLRLQKPSDDPIAFRQVTSLRSRLSELTSDKQSLNSANSILNNSVVQLQEYSDIISRARVLTLQGIQSIDDGERIAIATEMDGLLSQLQDISISRFDGQFMFGGTRSTAAPFAFAEPDDVGNTLIVDYHGSNENSTAFVGQAVAVDTYYAGNELFSSPNRGDTIIYGGTGVRTGTGTDTMIGRAALQITHETTTILGGSGLGVGTDSAEFDTVLGPVGVHSVTVVDTSGDGSAGTLSLNGGPEVAYTNGDTNLEIVGPRGEKMYVDTTAIAAGFNGTVDVSAAGNLSVDGGVTTTPIDYSSNQIVMNDDGQFVTLDTSKLWRSGTNFLEFPGTSNAFQVLYELSQDLKNTRGLDSQHLSESLNRRLGELDTLGNHALNALGDQSTSLRTLETLRFRIEDLELSVETQLSEIQTTDIPEAVLRLENSQALLQYTYAVTSQITSLGLLDFLR